jgi:hypothetical protein
VKVSPAPIPVTGDLPAWETAAASLANEPMLDGKRFGGSNPKTSAAKTSTLGGVRYGLVNSLATQPEPPSNAWVTIPLAAIAREEQSANKGTHLKREAVPLHGELREKNHATNKHLLRRKQVMRDVAAVEDLVW